MKIGNIVLIEKGNQAGSIGVIDKVIDEDIPTLKIITEAAPYGEWIPMCNLKILEESEENDNKRKTIYSRRAVTRKDYDFLTDDRNPYEVIMEMAEIKPKLRPESKIRMWIESNEGPIPHVHVFFGKSKLAYIKLGSAEYLNGHNKSYVLNSKERKELVRFFNADINVSIPTKTGVEVITLTVWQYAVSLWQSFIQSDDEKLKVFNKEIKVKDGQWLMPDYNELKEI